MVHPDSSLVVQNASDEGGHGGTVRLGFSRATQREGEGKNGDLREGEELTRDLILLLDGLGGDGGSAEVGIDRAVLSLGRDSERRTKMT